MTIRNMRNYVIFLFVSLFFISVSCNKHNNDNSKIGDDVTLYNKIDSLQIEVESLSKQIQLYKDTISDQKRRLEEIRTILEPLIQ